MKEELTASDLADLHAKYLTEEERHLDGPPPTIRLSHKNVSDVYNIAQSFISMYNYIQNETPNQLCTIDLNGTSAQCDYVPFIALKTLITLSITSDQQLSKICINLFKKLLSGTSVQTDHGIVITQETFEEYISKLQLLTYYGQEILRGIRYAAYPSTYLLIYWREISFCGEDRYENAKFEGERYIIHHTEIENEKDLDDVLNKAYAEAKSKKTFLQSFNTKDVPKPLIGMMYLTFLNNPDVFKEYIINRSKDGFMV